MGFTANKLRLLVLSFDALLLIVACKLKDILACMLSSESECAFLEKGMICPACGGTRSTYYFFSGDFQPAFTYHPAVFCIIIYLIILTVLWNLDYVFGLRFAKKLHSKMVDYRVVITLAVCYVVIGLSRNFIEGWAQLY